MQDVIDVVFPEDANSDSDLLLGLPDQTGGKAPQYFAALDVEDREIVQWYCMQGITPASIEFYVLDLLQGYDHVDPERRSQGGLESAHAEIARIKRYYELYQTSDNFFPLIEQFSYSVIDDDGKVERIHVEAWGSLRMMYWYPPDSKSSTPETQRVDTPIFEYADGYIEDPLRVSPEFKSVIEYTRDYHSAPD